MGDVDSQDTIGALVSDRIAADRIEIATVWHTSQDRRSAPKR